MFVRTATASTTAAALLGAGALLLPADRPEAPDQVSAQRANPVVVAHRGASGYAPENTLAAVDAADALGIDWVENDVHRSRDGVLVVLHDTDLKRTTDVEEVFPDRAPWAVKDFTAAELAKLDAGSWFGEQFTGARIPTLTQFLHRLERNRQKLLLEIKSPATYPGIERDIIRTLGRSGWLDRSHVRDRLVIQSFGADSVKTVHALRPDITTGFLGTPAVADLPSYAAFTDQINPSYATIGADYVAAVQRLKGPHGKRLRVNTWTVNKAADAVKARDYGVDGIITNFPDVVRDATS
ncbi:glycerophosphodiester phosphodiesterase [Streptomyces sp. SID7982]|uniref:Glycerophosphodiester phosphodiesterase family protein n=1 Tax=Streptomyces pakalii TaxID=3036494 RepID=A0ABT7D6I3_9ACTN|nr:glycerophosphodiester phosphodiesterase family protein [Streptomyces pakalii]MDJ1641413.1 glycerophosphodiester phosphodiesterase family protein [Streptomyces pakalii]NEE32942.1 glycerophosphodiester phosphodiesterase [Streptomyces sp. SID7982]